MMAKASGFTKHPGLEVYRIDSGPYELPKSKRGKCDICRGLATRQIQRPADGGGQHRVLALACDRHEDQIIDIYKAPEGTA